MKRFLTQRTSHEIIRELNITPLLDLAFTLLIIFIITTPLLEHSVEIELPSGKTPQVDEKKEKDERKKISINEQGVLVINEQVMSLEELETQARDWKLTNPQVGILIYADKKILYGTLMGVLDVLRKVNIERFGFAYILNEKR